MIFPLNIKVEKQKDLIIKWNDETVSSIPLARLRIKCPCATCNSEIDNQSKAYIPVLNENQVTVRSINVVGSYAVSIMWNDGHNTGIFEYSYLKKLSDEK